jgi:predicted Zn-dependent peptidase
VTAGVAIAVSGKLSHDEAIVKIAKAFAGLPVGPRFARPAVPEPIEREPRTFEGGDGTGPVTVRLGWSAPGADSPDWPAMVIVSDILGSIGQRLAETVRIHHAVATGIDASYLDFSDAGALMLGATVPPDQKDSVLDLLLTEIGRLRGGDLSDADVAEAIRATAGQRAVDAELNLRQTNRALEEEAGVLESYDEMLARLQGVTPAEVQRIAQTYLDPVNYSLVLLHQ